MEGETEALRDSVPGPELPRWGGEATHMDLC